MSIQALRERVASLNREANDLLAGKGDRIWSAEDKTKWDGLQDEIERGMTQLEALQRNLDDNATRDFSAHSTPADKGKTKMTDGQRAVEAYLRKMTRDLSAEEATLIRNTMSTTTGSEGGFTVPAEVASTLIDLQKYFGAMRRVASQITTAMGGPLSYPTSDGRSEEGEIVAQNASATSADPVFGTRDLATHKFGSKVFAVPIELLQDSNIDVVGMVVKRARDRIGRIQNRMYTVGTGSGQPQGWVPAASVGKTGATGQVTTIIYDDLVDIVDALDVAYLEAGDRDPVWMFGQTLRRTIRKIKDTTGRPIWTPGYEEGATAAMPDRLLGYPVQINNDMAAPAANAKSLGFGRLDNYLIRDAMEVQLFRFEDSAYISKGQVGFLAWARSGGNLMDLASAVVYQHPAS